MIVCKSRKFIFLRVPKTASTSLSFQIQKNMDFRTGDFATVCANTHAMGFEYLFPNFGSHRMYAFKLDEHAILERLTALDIMTREEMESFAIYGIIRNPVDRFRSEEHTSELQSH